MGKNKARSAKLFAFFGMLILGVAVAVVATTVSQAQSSGIKPLQLSSITSVSSSNPAGNYYWSYANNTNKLWNDNNGISLWTGNFPTPYTECGHLGMAWNLSNTTDPQQANVWENRSTCNGYIAVGIADKVEEQVLTVTGVSQDGKPVTLNINVPAVPNGRDLSNWKLYVDDTGGTYYCRPNQNANPLLDPNNINSRKYRYPSDCDYTIDQALTASNLARAGNASVAGNGLCQTGESPYTTPQDCGSPKTFSGQAAFQSGDAGGTIENNGIIKQKVINLRNTGSHPDTFRTTLPINPESRCGLRTSDGTYPPNTLPNPLPTTLDTALAVNEAKYINVVCVTNGLAAGPFTWSYKTVSLGAVEVNRPDVNTVIAEVQDTVAVTVPISCTDSDNGQSYSVKGTATGTYAGATPGYIRIYGQEPDPLTPKATTNNYSTFIDHCANSTQLNEAFCDVSSGKLSAIGTQCANGCSGGVCLSAPISPTSGNTCSPTGSYGCAADANTQLYCSPSTSKWQFSQYCSTSTRTCNASSGMCKAICGDNICGTYETAAECPGYNDCTATVSDAPATGRVTQLFPGQYSNTKFSITVEDSDGIKEFSVKKADNTSVYGGSPGASGNVGACGGANMYKTITSGTVTLNPADFPLNMTVTDCKTGAAAYSTTIPALGSASSSCTGINISTTKSSYTKGENVNYTYSCAAPSAGTVISYIAVQVVKPDGTATTYNTGTNVGTSQSMGFSTSNLDAGSYLIRTCLNSTCSAGSTNSVSFTITAATTTTTTPADSSLVGYWKFDGNGTNEVLDKPAAAVSGNASFNVTGGKIGGYLYVPTATDSAKIPYNSVYDLPDSFTISFWFRQRANQSANQNLIYKGSAPNNYNFNISRWLWNEYNQGPVIAGHTAANTGFWTQPSNPNQLAHNEWHHVAFTKSPDYHAYYLDGVLIGSKDITASSNSEYGGPAKTPHTDIIIGDSAIDTDFDDLKIYNRALTLAEIAQSGPFPSAATTTTTTTTPTTTTPPPAAGTANTTVTPTAPSACATGEKCVKGSWCSGGQQCFYPDEQLTCVAWPAMASGATAAMSGPMDQPACPAGTSPCRDSQCVPPGQSVPASSGKWCGASTAYYSKDGALMYCAASKSTVPAGYSACRSTDTTCKQKGDKWTDTNSSYYCMYAQKCNNPAGGGSCVSWDETCPAGTKYCNLSDTNCLEPGEYKTIVPGSANSYWCGGGSGMTFHSSTQSYCAPKKAGMMWTGADIKEVLTKLGAGWGVCRPSDTNCIEPGKTGPSNGWCGWSPPGYMMSPASSANNEKRTCPSLDSAATVTTTVTPQTPVVPGQEPVVTNQVVVPPSVAPGQMRECSENEMPGIANNCRMPMYRWNIGARTWEKCDSNKPPVYINVKDNPKAAYTNCESFNMAIEKEWRTERFQVRDPVKYGEWYMPAWDAATVSLQYDPATDQLGECKTNSVVAIMPAPGQMPQYVSPCMPIPAEDKIWMLKKFRAEYKMSQMWRSQQTAVLPTTPAAPAVPGRPVATLPIEEFPILPPMPVPVIPTIPANQCRGYLAGIRGSLNGDKQFWKDMKSQFKQAPADYSDAAAIKKLLDDSKTSIVEIEKIVKANKCDSAKLAAIQEKQNNLHQDIFSELSSYMPDLHDFVQYQQCANNLKDKSAQLNKLLGNGIDDESKVVIEELVSGIEAKLQELKANISDFEYDAKFECEQFSEEIDFEMMPLVRAGDKELNRIIDDVVESKLRPAMDELSKELEDRGRKIDSLIVQVAELHKAVEEISKSAVQISEQITTSYTALSRMSEEFAVQKTQIQEAKDKLIPLVETAISMMKNKRCVGNADRELLVQEFGNAASINWYGERADEMEKRFNLFITSCEQKNVAPADILAFQENMRQAAEQNQKISYEQHLTPFVDVPTHEWYYGGMVCGEKAGFMTQGRPKDLVLKQEALLMIMRAAGMQDKEVTGDCALTNKSVTEVSPYAVCAVNKAAEKGIDLHGSVTDPILRLEIAKWVTQLVKLPKTKPDKLKAYIDLKGLSAAEKDIVESVISNEIMVGTVRPNASTFGPHDPFTRGSLAVVLNEVLEAMGNPVCSK